MILTETFTIYDDYELLDKLGLHNINRASKDELLRKWSLLAERRVTRNSGVNPINIKFYGLIRDANVYPRYVNCDTILASVM